MKPEIVELPHRRTAAPARGRIRAAGAREGPRARLSCPARSTVRSDRRLLRRLLQNLVSNAIKYTPQRPRAGRLPAARRQAAHRGLRHRPRHSVRQAATRFSRSSSGSTRAPGSRAASASACRSSSASRACSTTRSTVALQRRPRLAAFRSTCRSRAALPSSRHGARGARRRPRAARRHRRAVHRQRAERSWTAWRRCSAAGAAASLKAPDLETAVAAIAEVKVAAGRPAGRLPSRRGQRHRRDRRAAPALRRASLPAILITADRSPRVREAARAPWRPGAEQAAEAGGAARAAGAMAGAARGGGGVDRTSAGKLRSGARRTVCGHWPSSILAAAITAWVRLSTPSFCRIAETCALTVASETQLVGDLLVEQPLRQHHQHPHLLRRQRCQPRHQVGGLGVRAGAEIDVGRRPDAAVQHARDARRASPRCRASWG